MTIKTIDVGALQAVKDALLSQLSPDTEIILTEGGQPIARLTAIEQTIAETGEHVPDLFPGGWMSDDFKDPLPDEFWFGED
jgi:antitoxin (DNA-binding transcriptional repressor) of toxin-antitoxin stability system